MNEQFEQQEFGQQEFGQEQFEQEQFEQEQFEQEQFEHLAFAGEGELESERGARRFSQSRAPAVRRGTGRPTAFGTGAFGAGASGQARPGHSRPGRFRPWPLGPWPYYGGAWPVGVAPGEPNGPAQPGPGPGPGPAPQAPPDAEPEPGEPGADASADEPQGEIPPTLNSTLNRLPASQRPAYLALGSVTAAISDPRSAAPGLYLIEFTSNGQRRAYSGQSGNVRKRLQQHLLCARMLGLSLAGHQVYVAPLPALGAAQRRAMEQRIHTDMFARNGGVLTNQRRELELELLGPQWA